MLPLAFGDTFSAFVLPLPGLLHWGWGFPAGALGRFGILGVFSSFGVIPAGSTPVLPNPWGLGCAGDTGDTGGDLGLLSLPAAASVSLPFLLLVELTLGLVVQYSLFWNYSASPRAFSEAGVTNQEQF